MTGRLLVKATLPAALAACLVLGGGPGSSLLAQDSGIGIAIGSRPGPAEVQDLEGNTVDLMQYVAGKPALIEFWATWCPVCKKLEPAIRAAHEKYGSDVEFIVVGVGVSQTPRSIRRHLENDPMPGRVLFDAGGAAVRAFRVPATSFIAVLDASGTVRYTGSGENQDIEAAIQRALQR